MTHTTNSGMCFTYTALHERSADFSIILVMMFAALFVKYPGTIPTLLCTIPAKPVIKPKNISTGTSGTIMRFTKIPSIESMPILYMIYGSVSIVAESVVETTSLSNFVNLFLAFILFWKYGVYVSIPNVASIDKWSPVS